MSAQDMVIQNVLWQGRVMDLFISRGKIQGLQAAGRSSSGEKYERREGGGLCLLPGLTDSHVHLREPGQEYKEDIASGLAAAARGGFCRVLAMANTDPVNDSPEVTRFMLARARKAHPQGPQLLPVGGLTRGLAGQELAPFQELAAAGCIAFSNDGLPVKDNQVFLKGLRQSRATGLRVIDHCEDPDLAGGGVINQGQASRRLGLRGQPTLAESLQVARDILTAAYLDVPVHLAHISCRESVELIAWAKQKSIRVSAETCPHYLLFDETSLRARQSLAKVNPPLRTHDDVLAVRQAVRERVIDILVTDHAPHAQYEKERPLEEAPFGISGLDTGLALTWSLVQEGELSLDDLIRCWGQRPAEIFNLPRNRFRPGDPADFVLFDPEAAWKVTPENMVSRGKNTPCLGMELQGRVRALYIKGRDVLS
ncbi:MAG: dihydroorotase [Thermodesulfobacteriota bacterium]